MQKSLLYAKIVEMFTNFSFSIQKYGSDQKYFLPKKLIKILASVFEKMPKSIDI